MEARPQVSIIIVSFNTKKLLIDCIESIFSHVKCSYEIIVVDNASEDGSPDAVRIWEKKHKGIAVHIIGNKGNVGFAAANNQGMKKSKGNFLLLLNSDTLLTEDSISLCLEKFSEQPKLGIASCKLKNRDGSLQATGGYFPTPVRVFLWMTFLDDLPGMSRVINVFHPKPNYYKKDHMLDWVTGAFFLFKRELLSGVGFFDEDYFMYVEELDYCYRARKAGWRVAYFSSTSIIHFGQASGSSEFALLSEYKNLILYFKKHFPSNEGFIRICLKTGALIRMGIFAILGQSVPRKIYAKAFSII